ncbi:MAG: family N-acetyltransferase [Enterovirga sp.]|jgi:hypothetical protein|nr:family N-acetyltransferase [Enterovirga sp.]
MSVATEHSASSVFHENWWLDAATGGSWTLLETGVQGGYTARLPLVLSSSFGRPVIKLPPLTRTLGPVLVRSDRGGAAPTARARNGLMEELIGKLPPGVPFALTFDPSVRDLHPFAAHGFHIELEYTFRIAAQLDSNAVWKGLRDYTRTVVRRAGERFLVERSRDTARFVRFYAENVAREGQTMKPRPALMRRILDATVQNDAGIAMFCSDPAGVPVAAIFLVWDRSFCYYLLSTRHKELAGKGGGSLLTWEALKFAAEQGLGFDFDGANHFVLQFGAEPTPRWIVSRIHNFERAAKLVLARLA